MPVEVVGSQSLQVCKKHGDVALRNMVGWGWGSNLNDSLFDHMWDRGVSASLPKQKVKVP